MKWLLRLLEKMGRKKVLMDFTGQVIAYRWYVLYREEDEDERFIARFPNIYIHQNLRRETPDGPDAHRHAWNTYSWMISGGYSEEVNGVLRRNPRWSWARLKHTDYHRIVATEPNAWSVFCHGFRRGPWGFRMKACDAICETCAGVDGVCMNTKHVVPHATYFGSKKAWRSVAWFHVGMPGLARRIARRQAAIKKVRVVGRDEVNARVTKELVERGGVHEAA